MHIGQATQTLIPLILVFGKAIARDGKRAWSQETTYKVTSFSLAFLHSQT